YKICQKNCCHSSLLSNALFCRRTSYLHKIIDAPGWYNKNCSSIVTIDETT
ncbi:hypothetical protein HMPREF1333_02624, partial [Enterococcus faecalis ERV37]